MRYKKIIGIFAVIIVSGIAAVSLTGCNKPTPTNNDVVTNTPIVNTNPITTNNVNENTNINTLINEPNLTNNKNTMSVVKITTNKGDITIELFADDAPKTVENFVTLANKDFYNGIIFHRVISGFMIQGGDPTGTSTGGPGYKFADELNPNTPSYKTGYVRGTVAMANAGPNTNGSQFFIMHKDVPLNHDYTIFGRVISGLETVDAIASTKTGPGDRPAEDVVMTKIEVVK